MQKEMINGQDNKPVHINFKIMERGDKPGPKETALHRVIEPGLEIDREEITVSGLDSGIAFIKSLAVVIIASLLLAAFAWAFWIFFIEPLLNSEALAQEAKTWTVSLEWDPNTETDLAGYRLYLKGSTFAGTVAGVMPAQEVTAGTHGAEITVNEGIHFFVVTAFDRSDNESAPSNEVSISFDSSSPAGPVLLHIDEWKCNN